LCVCVWVGGVGVGGARVCVYVCVCGVGGGWEKTVMGMGSKHRAMTCAAVCVAASVRGGCRRQQP
jgi:hypothetical protein